MDLDQTWEQRYQSGDTPWEKGEPSPGLVDWLAENSPGAGGTVLVPGCGTGHDVRAFARSGFRAVGLDIAPSALESARKKTAEAGMEARFILGDFLRDHLPEPFDWIFEHTCFCAIQPVEREAYVEAVRRGLKPNGQFLAVNYLIPDTEGPPFGTSREEQLERFSPHFQLLQEWVPRSYPHRTGLERMFWWKRRG